MGKKLDAMLGRSFKTEKFRSLLNLTITRLGVLKNQRRARCSLTTKDVLELLQRGQSESALLRVEHVIKDQNMWDAFVLIEEFCHVLRERACLIENEKTCPDELKEAIASLIFVSSRVAELPELVEIRSIFTSRFGKEFTSSALDLRGASGVNVKMIQKMSTRHPSLDTKLHVLKEIAMENDIQLNLEGQLSEFPAGSLGLNRRQSGPSNYEDERDGRAKKVSGGDDGKLEEEEDPLLAGSGRKYADVASAAQAAFESAASAAAAARAAVELSKAGNVRKGFDDHDRSNSGGKSSSFVDQNAESEETELKNLDSDIIEDSDSESDGVRGEEDQENPGKLNPKRIMGSSRLGSEKTPQEQCISTKKQDPIEQLTSDSQVTKKDGSNNSRADPRDYEERSETGREEHMQRPIWRLKRQTQGGIEKELAQEETKRWFERRFNFVSVRTTPGSRQ